MLNAQTGQYPFDKTDLKKRATFDGSNNEIYCGYAQPGVGEGETKWQICKKTYSGTNLTAVDWASGTHDYVHEWDERESYSYS